LTGGRGVDLVIEVGGEATLAQSLVAVAGSGDIAGVGMLTGRPDWSALRTPARVSRVHIGSRDQFEDMLRAISANAIRPVVDRVFPLEQIGTALKALREGTIFGKACIQLAD
jgi:NADPH:quinone reductase-like Zn-dependent oxidoreductase